MNILQENKNKQVNEIKKSYQDMTRFKIEIGLLKGNQTEMMLEMTNAISQIETLMETFTKRMNGSCEKQRTGAERQSRGTDHSVSVEDKCIKILKWNMGQFWVTMKRPNL